MRGAFCAIAPLAGRLRSSALVHRDAEKTPRQLTLLVLGNLEELETRGQPIDERPIEEMNDEAVRLEHAVAVCDPSSIVRVCRAPRGVDHQAVRAENAKHIGAQPFNLLSRQAMLNSICAKQASKLALGSGSGWRTS